MKVNTYILNNYYKKHLKNRLQIKTLIINLTKNHFEMNAYLNVKYNFYYSLKTCYF